MAIVYDSIHYFAVIWNGFFCRVILRVALVNQPDGQYNLSVEGEPSDGKVRDFLNDLPARSL